MADAKTFQSHINYQFHNCSLLEEAFLSAGASVSDTNVQGPKKGNKRLALVGDAALRLAVIDEWFKDDSDPAAGHQRFLTIGTNDRLKNIATNWEMEKFLVKNPCQQGECPKETLAATVEAILGAVWVDSDRNLEVVQNVLKKLSS
ncbi:ribonuclease III [Karstenula rhodostoma CBS 690.94]|uniref:Ribonuclease III n=1 Tax=Karstenula rhodostoma CBS 690.94 TaxID=1392251 RepID=A0A9P4PTC2_9PLEO|nr:ribonuclease III [Karstenula rhodostoma CBS 690.94]